jgi:hypothetical protein
VAKGGLTLALTVYVSLMGVHFLTGLSACGALPDRLVNDFSVWSDRFFAFFIM